MSKQPRKRIAKGVLVRSTNPIQDAYARSLTIIHYYRPLSYVRVRREVITINATELC